MTLVARWKFDELNAADTAVDSMGAYNLTPVAPPTVATGRFNNCRKWTAEGQYLRSLTYPPMFADPLGTWSLSWWMACHTSALGSATAPIFAIRRNDSDVQHHLVELYTSPSTSFQLGVLWNYAAGSQAAQNTNVNIDTLGIWNHHALTRSGNALKWYINGALVFSGTMSNSVLPGVGYTYEMALGRGSRETVPHWLNNTSLDDFRIYDTELTAAEVLAIAWPDGGVTPDDTAPIISNVTASLASIYSAWTCRVTENSALRLIQVSADYANGSSEIIFRGSLATAATRAAGFRTAFAALSAWTEVTPGLVFDVSAARTGGWPSNPTINVDAIDTAGNEAA